MRSWGWQKIRNAKLRMTEMRNAKPDSPSLLLPRPCSLCPSPSWASSSPLSSLSSPSLSSLSSSLSSYVVKIIISSLSVFKVQKTILEYFAPNLEQPSFGSEELLMESWEFPYWTSDINESKTFRNFGWVYRSCPLSCMDMDIQSSPEIPLPKGPLENDLFLLSGREVKDPKIAC